MTQNNKLTYYLSFFVFLYISLVIVGIFNNYSPVPFWDMWDGYLDFYVKVINGDWHAWFAQHNEHRTIFSNLLFFIDIHFFGGQNIFLLIANFALMASIAWLTIAIIKDVFSDSTTSNLSFIVSIFSVLMVFSWIQEENITWGFQSQFFAAYFFPLLSFYLYVKSVVNNQTFLFSLSLLAGIISAGTMANGVIALPILFILSLFIRKSISQSIGIFLLALFVVVLYFSDYHTPGGHGSLSTSLTQHPKDFLRYFFAYLGGVFYYIGGKNSTSIPQFFGIVLVVLSSFFTYLTIMRKETNRYYLVVLAFLLYYGGTAFGTAGGRAIFGLDQAFASRYITPSLIAWSLIIVVTIHYFRNRQKVLNAIFIFMGIISVSLLIHQLPVFKDHSDNLFDRKIAILSLEMGIRDEEYIKTIFPFLDWVIDMSKEPIKRNLSVFGNPDFKDIADKIGDHIQFLPNKNLIGHLDESSLIKEDPNAIRIRGWIFDKETAKTPKKLFIVNENKEIIGCVLSGYLRNDVKELVNKHVKNSGFLGYLFKNSMSKKIYLVDIENNKKLEVLMTGVKL